MDTMLTSVLRREINRQRAVLPFSLRIVAERSFSAQPEESGAQPAAAATRKKQQVAIDENPFFDKYAEKIKRAQELKAAAAKTEDISKEQQRVIAGLARLESSLSRSPDEAKDPSPTRASNDSSTMKPKTLADVVHMDLLEGHTADEVKEIWTHFHRTKPDCIYAVVPSTSYDNIYDLATQYPAFLYPLPRADKSVPNDEHGGYEFFLGQFNGHAFYFTSLIIYQRYKEAAPPIFVMRFFPELSNKKGIVLMNGEFDKNSINMLEAQCLANQVKLYYNGEDLRKKLLLHKFLKDPEVFNYADLISEFERSLIPQTGV